MTIAYHLYDDGCRVETDPKRDHFVGYHEFSPEKEKYIWSHNSKYRCLSLPDYDNLWSI